MLYLSTKNKADSFTAYRVLHSESAPDGGMFMPMQLPKLDDVAMDSYEQMTFGETTANILNLFFGTQISGWDVDFAVGRQAVELVSFGYKVSLAESWHNPARSHDYFVNRLYSLVTEEKHPTSAPNSWFHTAVNIALLFGIYGKYCRQEIYEFDVAIEAGDLQLLLAVRYAQKMGLPIRKVILGTVEDDGLWELFTHGKYQMHKKVYSPGFESFLWLELGYHEVQNYLQCWESRAAYKIKLPNEAEFQSVVFATVVGDDRVNNVVDSTLRTSNYLIDMDTARAFGALQDYRAKTGENKNTLLFAQSVPNK